LAVADALEPASFSNGAVVIKQVSCCSQFALFRYQQTA
jgi:hypothetical protein